MTTANLAAIQAARQRITQLPNPAVQLLVDHVDRLLRQIERTLQRGPLNQERARRLLATLQRTLDELSRQVTDVTIEQAIRAAQLAVEQTAQQLAPAYRILGTEPPLTAWTAAAQGAAVVITQHLEPRLQTLNARTWREAERILLTGITAGLHPSQVGRELARVLDIALWRATTIARTETLRAYRAATLATYQQAPAVVRGWRWHAKLDARTCPVCILLHGKEFPLHEPMESHPNCRCSPVVVPNPAFAFLFPTIEPGTEWLERQPVEVQQRILGPRRLELVRQGVVALDDLIAWKHDPIWGRQPVLRPLAELS